MGTATSKESDRHCSSVRPQQDGKEAAFAREGKPRGSGRLPGNASRPRRWQWARWFVAVVVLPVALLGVAELVLRGAGYGHSTRPFIERHCHGGTVHVLNGHFFDQFFFAPIGGTYLWNSWSWVEVTQPKPPKTCRVFVFGGSAAQGFPYGFYCFRRMIETMLQASYPQTQFEVYCAAFPAVDSHVMRPMAKACAELDPDVFVVYLGNNEANGPFGLLQAADRGATVPHLAFIRTCIRTSDIRLVQLTGNLAAWVQRLRPPADKSGRSTLDGSVQAELLDRVYDHYAANLEAICKAGIDAGASVVLCTVGSNIRDWRPSSSIHTAGLNSAALDEWQRLYDEGRAREEAGMWSGAVEAYEEAEGIDGVHADLHFRLGCCYWNLELYDTAREHFLRAWESDLFVWIRATPRGNEIVVNSAASKDGVYLADCALALQGASPHGVPGKGLFCDDCHLTFQFHSFLQFCFVSDLVCCSMPVLPPGQSKLRRPVP